LRLRRVHKYLIGYKVGGQKSFFECWLTAAELRDVRRRWRSCSMAKKTARTSSSSIPRMQRDLLGRRLQPVTDCFLIV
jgi:CRISPR-associated protein Cas2